MSSPVKIDWSKVNNPEQSFQRFASRRSVVYGTKGMVSSSQPLATEAGLEILRKGGNAGTYYHFIINPTFPFDNFERLWIMQRMPLWPRLLHWMWLNLVAVVSEGKFTQFYAAYRLQYLHFMPEMHFVYSTMPKRKPWKHWTGPAVLQQNLTLTMRWVVDWKKVSL